MGWKIWSTWLKGAFIGGIIGVVILLIIIIGGGFSIVAGGNPPIASLFYLGRPFGYVCNVSLDFITYPCFFLSPIINLVIIGAIIGLIIGKIKSKK